MKMLTILKNSICYPALMISCSTYDEIFMRKHPDYIANMANFQAERYRQLLRMPGGPIKSMRYLG